SPQSHMADMVFNFRNPGVWLTPYRVARCRHLQLTSRRRADGSLSAPLRASRRSHPPQVQIDARDCQSIYRILLCFDTVPIHRTGIAALTLARSASRASASSNLHGLV